MNINLYRKTLKASRELHGEIKKEGKGYNYKYFRTEDILPLALKKNGGTQIRLQTRL